MWRTCNPSIQVHRHAFALFYFTFWVVQPSFVVVCSGIYWASTKGTKEKDDLHERYTHLFIKMDGCVNVALSDLLLLFRNQVSDLLISSHLISSINSKQCLIDILFPK